MAALVDCDGHVSSLRRWPGRVPDYDQALDAIAELVEQLRSEAEYQGDTVVAVGVAIAAFLSADRDRVREATNLVGWRDRPFRADLASASASRSSSRMTGTPPCGASTCTAPARANAASPWPRSAPGSVAGSSSAGT